MIFLVLSDPECTIVQGKKDENKNMKDEMERKGERREGRDKGVEEWRKRRDRREGNQRKVKKR
jgi:hypothetical protein